MDQLNDTWLHSDKNKNLGKLVQWFEQPLEDSKFIMVSRCAVTPPGQASLGMAWDGVWPAGTIPGICSWAPNMKGDTRHTREAHTDQSLCVAHRPMAAGSCCSREVWNDLPEDGNHLLERKGQKRQRGPQSPCSAVLTLLCTLPVLCCASPDCCCCFHCLRSGPQLLSLLVSNPNHLSYFHPAACNKQLSLPPSLNSSFLLCSFTPVAVPPPHLSQSPTPSQTDTSSTLALCLYSPPNSCQGAAQFCTTQHNHTERNVLFPSGVTCGHWAWNLLLYLITLQNPLQGIIHVWFLHIKYTLTSSHLPPSKA